MIFKSYLGENYPCYQCFCPEEPKHTLNNSCEGAGILGAASATIGSIQSAKIIQEIVQESLEEPGFFLHYDVFKSTFRVSKILKDKKCKICSD
jgi:adenylyltransferase/sulfurtransferase